MRLGEPARGVTALPPATRKAGLNATAFVHDYLKDLILDLVVPPDTVITELDVAKATGLSRTPIREALLRLHEERLVEISPRRGALVPKITARQVRELYEVRFLLESKAIEIICAEQVTVAGRLVPLCDEQLAQYRNGADAPTLIKIDRRFHSTLIGAAGNTVMAMVNESLGDHHQRTGVLSFSLDRDRCVLAVEQHRDIAAALGRFDPDRALDALRQHLVAGERALELLLPH